MVASLNTEMRYLKNLHKQEDGKNANSFIYSTSRVYQTL